MDLFFTIVAAIVVALAVIWFGLPFVLGGPSLRKYDLPPGERGTSLDHVSPSVDEAKNLLLEMQKDISARSFHERVAQMREVLDRGVPGAPNDPESLGVAVHEVDAGGVPAEWVLAPNADPSRRLLYLHGGAFFAGSPRSHRRLTSRLSEIAGVAVLAIDYRLIPEHRRIDGIIDCQKAYRWILDHGPAGASAARELFVAGDSAGGNLTLMLIAWIRDQGLRQVDAAISICPVTDATGTSPSMRHNIPTDPMLGPTFGRLTRFPLAAVLLLILYAGRMRPSNPLISPVFGDLSDLPPTLVQASEAEMLFDDARRWVNKARSQGSPARLQAWPGMLHVWHVFAHVLPEANEAFDRIAEFIAENGRSKRRESR